MGSRILGDPYRRPVRVPSAMIELAERSAAEAVLAQDAEAFERRVRALAILADISTDEARDRARGFALALFDGRNQ